MKVKSFLDETYERMKLAHPLQINVQSSEESVAMNDAHTLWSIRWTWGIEWDRTFPIQLTKQPHYQRYVVKCVTSVIRSQSILMVIPINKSSTLCSMLKWFIIIRLSFGNLTLTLKISQSENIRGVKLLLLVLSKKSLHTNLSFSAKS